MPTEPPDVGFVSLVGAGPGDPGLLTLRGLECLRAAQVVVYDRLIGPELLRHARPDAELIYCGKGPDRHTLSQEEINAVLVERARTGKTVCRLKGGDPFVFGRGGEEALVLRGAGISFEVVPGISSAVAAGAYAGIPVTHRAVATSFAVITGHEDPTKVEGQVDWERLALAADTLVVLMGVGQLERIVAHLLAGGRSPSTPVALVSSATTPRQATVVSTLGEVVEHARAAEVKPPTVAIVGEVVALRPDLAWFDNRPLFGRRVLVTRTREQAGELSELLRRAGAQALEMPVIRTEAPESWEPFDAAVRDAAGYDWLIFTSANGVEYTRRRLEELGEDIRLLKGPRVAVIGPGTAAAARRAGLRVSLCPQEYVAEALAEALASQGLRGRRLLLLRAQEARETLPEAARNLGAQVTVVSVYRTLPAQEADPAVLELLVGGEVDVVTFASSSSVRLFMALLAHAGLQVPWERICVACIGPVTAAAARELGLPVSVMPREYTLEALVAALVEHLRCG